jgi:S-DNA-T family DNA segregation ATPase FtsK/SpoIIIE
MILFALGAACMVASIGGAAVTLSGGGKVVVKDTLHTCFTRARLFIRQKDDKDWVYTYPSVNGHEVFDDRQEYTFTLPIGVDPERLHKHFWVFEQGFGPHIDIEGDSSMFTMKVFNKGISQFAYNVSDIPLEGMHLPIVVGKSRSGWEVYDMVENPHLLIAGETGSGKSTQLRAIITTLILTKQPNELELYLADLKRSEFHVFKNSPHVKAVVNDKKELEPVLEYISLEMKRRGDLCDKYEVSNVIDLPFKLPFILLAIDEVALLKKDKKLMPLIEDITAIGRALSVQLIISMQRPDAKLLESGLKSNLTVRMAFKHADDVNSRITLNASGAEDIKDEERGLMLFKHNGLKKVQGPFLSLMEAKRLLKQK